MRLTNDMKSEFTMTCNRVAFLRNKFLGDDVPLWIHPMQTAVLKNQHGEELESYKIKLENLYLDTDLKERAFKYLLVFKLS